MRQSAYAIGHDAEKTGVRDERLLTWVGESKGILLLLARPDVLRVAGGDSQLCGSADVDPHLRTPCADEIAIDEAMACDQLRAVEKRAVCGTEVSDLDMPSRRH